jgi:hypothetical protein
MNRRLRRKAKGKRQEAKGKNGKDRKIAEWSSSATFAFWFLPFAFCLAVIGRRFICGFIQILNYGQENTG